MGEVASPLCFELAKRMKKPPRALAQEIANSLKNIPGVERVEGTELEGVGDEAQPGHHCGPNVEVRAHPGDHADGVLRRRRSFPITMDSS